MFIDSIISESNIQHSMLAFYKENTVTVKNRFQGILPTTMLTSLIIHNHFVSDVHMEDMTDMKCQLRHLNLEKYFIQQKHYQNCRHLC